MTLTLYLLTPLKRTWKQISNWGFFQQHNFTQKKQTFNSKYLFNG